MPSRRRRGPQPLFYLFLLLQDCRVFSLSTLKNGRRARLFIVEEQPGTWELVVPAYAEIAPDSLVPLLVFRLQLVTFIRAHHVMARGWGSRLFTGYWLFFLSELSPHLGRYYYN